MSNKANKNGDVSDRLTEYLSNDVQHETVPKTEIANQPEFYRIPRRFGSIPVDELPLGCDKEEQFYKIYPRISLPFQKAERVTFGHPTLDPNQIFWGDNLHVMRLLPSNSIDLIYIDPPFFSGRNYNIIFGDKNETRSFSDIWEGGMPGYLIWLNARLIEMKRLLKQTGTIYVHLDYHACHYVKLELDKIFGYDNFRGEIVWHYGGWAQKLGSGFSWKYDTILFYSKTPKMKFNSYSVPWRSKEEYVKIRKQKIRVDANGREYVLSDAGGGNRIERFLDEAMKYGQPVDSVWEIPRINNSDKKERIGYPTQKPEALLERIIKASSNEGDVVADFFCGGGTAPAVAQKLGRRWIACDQSRVAVAITQARIEKIFEKGNGTQSSLVPIPDVSIEYWGTYEIPTLVELSDPEFRSFVVAAYGGRVSSVGDFIHGFKREVPIFVGPAIQEKQVTKDDVLNFAKEITTKKGKQQGVMLAWAFAPSARAAAEKLMLEGNPGVELIKIETIEIESQEFRSHITKLHNEYESFLRFILPPEVRFISKRIKPLTYIFDVSESISLNPDGTIINVQWDFDFKGRFTPSRGYEYGRNNDGIPSYKVEHKFDGYGKRAIACRIQDDAGGEKIYPQFISIQ